ncbi:MAG: carboxypeptidase regulatory-like domain-containing protein [Deltaproteobacteria bacterium]|nr:carboxypeptidase regulatory-like domain-containing protein [Deltaproteobacteria bacterium]
MKHRFWAILPAALAVVCAPACSGDDGDDNTQTPAKKGSITGSVKTTAGVALDNASIVTDPPTVTVKSDPTGKYLLSDLSAGTYKVVVTRDGYVSKERTGITVADGASVTLDFQLEASTVPMGAAKLTVKDLCGTGGLAGATVAREGGTPATTGTDGTVSVGDLAPGKYTFTATANAYLPASVEVTVTAGGVANAEIPLDCQTHAAGEEARKWLATVGTVSPITSATALHDKLNDGDTSNDPKVLDVRAAADYAKGHVPGAINVGYKAVADDATLALLGDPTKVKLVDYCYTGHTGGIASAVLNMLGYSTQNMKFGIVSWTRDATVRGTIATPPDLTKNFTVETTARTAPATQTLPVLAFADAKTGRDVVKLAARAYLNNAAMKPTIAAQELFDNLNDGNTSNDPFIISVRKPEDYAKGHIPGAINIPWDKTALEANLKMIPTDREIVVYCYTGHTGAVATAVLGTLGYHKVRNLKYGMLGWTQDATVRAQAPYNDASDSHDFAFTTGTAP